jgi:LmbE family N-acetylglucosaminyl deacetylase
MEKIMFFPRYKGLLFGLLASLCPGKAMALEIVSAALSKDAYRVGEQVQLRLTLKNDSSSPASGISGMVVLRVADGPEVTRMNLLKNISIAPGASFESGYHQIWTVPPRAFLGLYELEVTLTGSASPTRISEHFVAYRQDLAVELLETECKQYVVGDIIRVRAIIRNLAQTPLRNLKLVMGRGYPWISGFGRGTTISGAPPEQVYAYPKPINLQPRQVITTEWFDTMKATVPKKDRPDIFNMFGWVSDASQKDLYDLELTNTFVVRPWNYSGPPPYHPYQHLYKFLDETDYHGVSYQDLERYDDALPPDTARLGSWMGFSPHYDDEVAYLPLVPRSQKANVPFHLVQMTAGDGNVESIQRYVSGISNPPDWQTLGYVRYYETVHASEIFGVKAGQDASHLGLPDGGLLPIFQDNSGKDFFMFTTGTDHSPYTFVYKKNLAYNREAIIQTLIELIKKRMPEDIYTPHPDEGHGDHRTTTFFVLEALRRMRQQSGYEPRVHVYVAYGAGDFPKAQYRYEPESMSYTDRTLLMLHFASWAYQSQFTIGERGGIRLPIDELRKQADTRWFRLLGW